jgi:ketosteroid isomerase-like protein
VSAPEQRAREFFEAYGRGDLDAVRAALDPELVSYVTNAEGGADAVNGRDAYMERLPDLHAAGGKIGVPQVLAVDDRWVLAMVEIRAERDGRELHNHAGFLLELSDSGIVRMWMVDALPEYSAEFWS